MSGVALPPNLIPLTPDPLHGSVVRPLRQRALREHVFETLLQAIVCGEIKAGDWLNHQRLAERFEVSATPVREALQELASFGIVDNQHNRGTVVRPFGPVQLEEIYFIRALLEAEATRLACHRLDPVHLNEIRSKTANMLEHESPIWFNEVPKIDKELHELIAETSGKQRLKEEIFRYHVFIFIPRTVKLEAHRSVLVEHLAIIDELLSGRAEKAAQAMLDHIANGGKACSSLLFSNAK
jgi:DNA-binding GntR family transcriptional regulator